MEKIVECPICANDGLKIELKQGERFVATGRALKDYPCVAVCKVCKRKIKYAVEKSEE
jgi:hypothetical protein